MHDIVYNNHFDNLMLLTFLEAPKQVMLLSGVVGYSVVSNATKHFFRQIRVLRSTTKGSKLFPSHFVGRHGPVD